ncbi:hypothetical protein BDP27DRAFT_1362213 [Rhodocollybia butyracea]|uniref:Uncharacterized protein n=1 Tax=Rhodocollybia butyracea TaxID=206335 RepID=A0A9P5U9H4_9AGAR|nr:hypothetical protein BDP27DRAFT_1362213 [Rhodocollybia butyracea]
MTQDTSQRSANFYQKTFRVLRGDGPRQRIHAQVASMTMDHGVNNWPRRAHSEIIDHAVNNAADLLLEPSTVPRQISSPYRGPSLIPIKPARALSLPPIEAFPIEISATPIKPPPTSPIPPPNPIEKTSRSSNIPNSTMTRTRRMDQLSAANRAKTRGEKARAAKTTLVMESVTIPVPRRAPKRAHAAAKTVEHPQTIEAPRPPTPGGGEPSVAPTETTAPSEGELTVLREGWKIIKRYSDDKVGAGAVSNYLDTVMDPASKAELEKGFSDVMSCEDAEARQIVEPMIHEKLKQFDHAPLPKLRPAPAKKQKTTFRPHFAPSPEDSTSRLPATKTTAYLRTPTLSPSSPCPIDFPSDNHAAVETFRGGDKTEEEATLVQEKTKLSGPAPMAPVEQDHTNEESTTVNVKKTKLKASAPAPEQDETAEEDEDEGDSIARKVKNSKAKGKGKARAPPAKHDKEKLSKETIKQAHALRHTYHDELEALAAKEGKSVAALLSARANAEDPFDDVMPDREDAEGRAHGKGASEDCEAFQCSRTRRQAYGFYGVSVFGFVVDPVTSRALAFGADPMSLAMREANPSHLRAQLYDYGAMIHLELMKKKCGDYLEAAKLSIIGRFHTVGSDHEALRTVLKDIWLHNLTLGVPDGLKGVSGMTIASHVRPIVEDFVLFWQQEAEAKKAEAVGDEDEDPLPLYADADSAGRRRVFEEDLVRFVKWDEDMRNVLSDGDDWGADCIALEALYLSAFVAKGFLGLLLVIDTHAIHGLSLDFKKRVVGISSDKER